MEQDKNNDHLDRFMHRAFDDFSANPSDGLWDKISADLPEAPSAGPAKVVPFIKPWQIAAAALILGLFLSQHYYFSSKIDALRDEIQQSAGTSSPNDTKPSVREPNIESGNAQNLTNEPAIANPSQDASHPASVSNGTPIDFYSTPINNTKKTIESKLPAAKKPSGVDAIPTLQIAAPSHSGTPEMAFNTNERLNSTEKTDDQPAKNVQKNPKVDAFAVIPSNDLPGTLSSNTTRPQLQFIGQQYITKVSPGLRTMLNAHVMPGFIHSRVEIPEPPGGPQFGERIFSDEQQTGSVLMAGLGIEKQMNKHFSLVSGVDYLKHTIEQTLPSPLKFKDRDHGHGGGPGGPPNDEHDFNYSFGTGNGSYAVDVELRAVDSTQQIDEDEQIDLELKTTHQVSFLSIPLALKYRLTHKHWTAFLMAGARVNYEVQNNESISDFTCNNSRFEFRNKPQLVRKSTEVRKVTADAIVAAGLEYRVRNVGIYIAPTFSAPLVKPVKDDRISVSSYTAGLNAGVQYYF